MNAPWRKLDLQGKFKLFALFGILIWLLTFSIVYYEIYRTNQTVKNLEHIEDLYNTILETRRYEKNYLLHQRRDSLKETLNYFDQARETLAIIASNPDGTEERNTLHELEKYFKEYKSVLDAMIAQGEVPARETEDRIRSAGKQMVDLSKGLLTDARSRVSRAVGNALLWPFLFMGLILLLIVLGAWTVMKKVVNPLVQLEKATEKIARGDFGAIPQRARIESEVDRLVAAFNRMVQELEARHEQIIHSRKIASLGTLVSGVAHELNNPINNIILTTDTLCGGRKIDPERRSELMEDILKQAIRASEIVKNLLDFSRAETSTIQEVDLAKLLRDTIQIAGNEITLAKVKLHQDIPENLPTLNGNRQGLQQVFLNLIINAVQAMSQGGELSVKAGVDKNGRIMVKVRDTGKGIAQEHLPHIFDPFFTTKEVGKGTGLGLSVSYGIIKKHGGQITVDSRPGKGTTFSVVIPIIEKKYNE
jgi:two-component system, NtrC family, sensor kinase